MREILDRVIEKRPPHLTVVSEFDGAEAIKPSETSAKLVALAEISEQFAQKLTELAVELRQNSEEANETYEELNKNNG